MAAAKRTAPTTLVVVESPAKAKTLRAALGGEVAVLATLGHLVDLPEATLGVDVERGFEPRYAVLKGKNRLLSDLKRAAREASLVLLATDPDREGEAIAWLLAEALGAPGGSAAVRRVLLHELTPEAIRAAVAAPVGLDQHRFEAQQARRILDRLVGFQASPVLWTRVRRGLSAGRVQSVALRLVVEREQARRAFRPEATWPAEVVLEAPGAAPFRARLVALGPPDPGGPPPAAAAALAAPARAEANAGAQLALLRQATYQVGAVAVTRRPLPAPPPFTTATLQQEAARRLGLSPRRTMALAQRLYEGVDLGEEGTVGLVTYVRTDATRLAPAAAEAFRRQAAETFGQALLPEGPNLFPPRPGAQAAHEAIRPTDPSRTPELLAPRFRALRERDLGRLYRLVWERALASQLAPAQLEVVEVEVAGSGPGLPVARLLARGLHLETPGWLAVHGGDLPEPDPGAEGGPDAEGEGEGEGAAAPWSATSLPALRPGQPLALVGLDALRQVTGPAPRYTEASLVLALDRRRLGRPSTFAAIVDTVQARGYVERVDGRLAPTALGERVDEALRACFPQELGVDFTAGLEARLDAVEEGTAGWREVLEGFYAPFRAALARAGAEAGVGVGERAAALTGAAPGAPLRGVTPASAAFYCPDCGKPMAVRWGRRGEFLSCSGYPSCRRTQDVRRVDGAVTLAAAPQGGPLLADPCPRACGGEVVERRSKRGKAFYGCSTWPACDFVSWERPAGGPCPDCGNPWLIEVVSRRVGPALACPSKNCGYRRALVGGAPPDAPPA